MTTLEKLAIQGIRSFSQDRRETLKFEKPLTLIVGPNGAGKTVHMHVCLLSFRELAGVVAHAMYEELFSSKEPNCRVQGFV